MRHHRRLHVLATQLAAAGETKAMISGTAAPGWEAVQVAFAENWDQRNEVGASCCVTWKGEIVVDLWGGVRDPADNSPWERDTIACVFSSTKGLVALGISFLIDRGAIDIQEKVITYWPEFGASGKEDLTVAQLLSHQAGLHDTDRVFSGKDLANMMTDPEYGWKQIVDVLAASSPAWPPSANLFAYHGQIFGHLAGELIQRVSGQPLMEFLSENILAPQGAEQDFFIGLHDSQFRRVAPIVGPQREASFSNAGEVRRAVIPSANGHTNGRGLAKIYAAVANAFVDNSWSLISPAQIDVMRETHSPPDSFDNSVQQGMRFGLGFRLSAADNPRSDYWFGENGKAFGHTGAGGASIGFADPEARLSFGYAANRFDQSSSYDGAERRKHIIRAVYSCLRDLESKMA